ncbi:MAG: hypothetical protein MK066_11560 [Crocinitomicaceae bacterium]|nr:hypothetical protein [Crocinitomicaceae bacterium]
MKFISFLFATLLMSSVSYAFVSSYRVYNDSSEVSSIDFIKMQAIVSARIIHFSWDVAAEKNGHHFIIEKSTGEGTSWSKVTRTESIGDHKDRHTYEISEINLPEAVSEIFRIRRVDVNGDSEVLDSFSVNQPVLSNLKLIPDPKKPNRSIGITYESLINSKGVMTIKNKNGEEVERIKLELSDGYNRLVLPLKNFESGDYIIVIKNEFDDGISRRLVVY